MGTLEHASRKETRRSGDFRYVPCDAINLAVSDNGIKLIFGVEELDRSTLELVGVHMTHKTAMLLKAALTQGLDHYQETTGVTLEEPDLSPDRGVPQ